MQVLLAVLILVLLALAAGLFGKGDEGATPRPGDDGGVLIDGDQKDEGDSIIPEEDGNFTKSESGNIVVHEPDANDAVSLPLVIEGEARVFENTFNYRLLDENGDVLVERYAMTDATDAGQFGAFEERISYPQPSGDTGTLEVFVYSAMDGSEADKITIPVKFADVASMTVKTFFTTEATADDCSLVTAVERRIPKTSAVGSAAIEQLLAGPTSDEVEQGFGTSINTGVTMKRLVIEDGVATVEFDETLEAGVGGSCKVMAIRAQIEETLKQFPTVESVVIMVEGRDPEEVLQP